MFTSWPLLAVFGCAVVYTIGALCAKRALSAGATVWQVNFAANMAMSVLFLPFWFGADVTRMLTDSYKPILAAGSILYRPTFYLCSPSPRRRLRGDPPAGSKSYFRCLHHQLSLRRSCRREMVGSRGDLHLRDFPGHRRTAPNRSLEAPFRKDRPLFVDCGSLLCSYRYTYPALGCRDGSHHLRRGDVLVCGHTYVLPLCAGRRLPSASQFAPNCSQALVFGTLILGAQNLVMAVAIRFSGDATAVNIVYSSRCVLSVVLAWATARWLGSREATLPRRVLFFASLGRCSWQARSSRSCFRVG